MPDGWCESIAFNRMRKWKSNVSEASPYLWPFFISMVLTQIAWVGVYQCSDDNNIVKQTRYMAGDRSVSIRSNSRNFDFNANAKATTPKTLEEYITESLEFVAIMVVSFVVVFLIMWFASHFKKGELCFEAFCVLHYSSYCAGTVIRNTMNLLDIDPSVKTWIAGSCILVYFCCAVLAFFTHIFPARITQCFGLTNHVFLSVVLLTLFPGGSLWIITAALCLLICLAYCIFVRLNWEPRDESYLRKPKLADTNNDDRFSIYEVRVPRKADGYTRGQIEAAQSNECSTIEIGQIYYVEFVASSILVGQSITYGIIPGVITACSVLIGVVCSVNVERKLGYSPHYGATFGLCGHFLALIVQYAVVFLLKRTA